MCCAGESFRFKNSNSLFNLYFYFSLSEETPEVQEEIESLWKKAGELYYLENQNELQQFNLVDDKPKSYPVGINRPPLGCRALVKRALQVLNPILHEMEDWKEDVRLHATKLLKQIVIHSEDFLATKYFDINAVLCKTCQDEEQPIVKEAIEVASLVGYFVNAKTWSKYIYEELKVRQSKLGILKCMNALFESSVDPLRFDSVKELSQLLLDCSIYHNDSQLVQLELMKLLRILINGTPENDEEIFQNLYIVTLKSTAVSYDDEEVRSAGIDVINQLVLKFTAVNSETEMHNKFLKKALETLDQLDKAGCDSVQVTVLYGIISICRFQVNDNSSSFHQHKID